MLLKEILPRIKGKAHRVTFLSETGNELVKSFDELHQDTLTLVDSLHRVGIAAGERVGIWAPNSYHWMVWDLALLTLDAISVALPQEASSEPMAALVDRLGLRLLAVAPEFARDAAGLAPFAVHPDNLGLEGEVRPASQPPYSHRPATLSHVFSSGTTGKTKGLIISAPGTERLVGLFHAAFGIVEQERLLSFLPFANYQQRMTYYFCLYYGAEFVSVPFPRLFASLKIYQPTFVIAPPVFHEAIHNMTLATVDRKTHADPADYQGALAQRLKDLLGGRMRYMITGMAPIKRTTLDFFWAHGVELYEAFGITEAGMVCWNKPGQVKLGTVGRPAEAGTVALRDDGEVLITRDALLSFGYFESSEEDARSTFVVPGSVATGDIAEFDSDGYVTIVGRKKDAIITRSGEKFHPEAIEAKLQVLPGVKAVVVLGGDSVPAITALAVLPANASPTLGAELKELVVTVNATLPAYQQVKRLMLTEVDLTIENGLRTKNMKLNRRAIAQQYLAHPAQLIGGKG
jgi:long-subunit acyl-CoA synthetase (AMP-forming)